MSFVDNFDELKSGLKDKWLDYYEANQSWINSTGIHNPRNTHPDYNFVLGVISALEPKVAELIYFLSIRIGQSVGTIAMTLDLYFDPRIAIRARAEQAKHIQEAKLLTSGDDDSSEDEETEEVKVDNLGLDILRREASQLMNNS